MSDLYPVRGTIPEEHVDTVKMVGTGASAPTKVYGPGVTITRDGVGEYTLTWSENPGTFLGIYPAWQATTPADLKGYTVVAGAFASNALPIIVYNASDAADDLEAAQWLTLRCSFSPSGAIPG